MCDRAEVEKVFGRIEHLCICNTSGSGKTRRILESLTVYWGFYLVAVPDANGVGVRDLQEALNGIADYLEWISDLRPLSSGERGRQNDINCRIAHRSLKRVLAARIVVFQLFLQLAIEVDGELQEKHKRIWLLFQLSNLGRSEHPFVQIMRTCLRNASTEALDILIRRLGAILDDRMPGAQFIVGLDEAQQAIRLYRHSFASFSVEGATRSILREIVKIFTSMPIKLVVSGTGVSLEELREAMASGVSKRAEIPLFYKLGMFDTWPTLKLFLEQYIPHSFLKTSSGHHLQQRIREYLLGRYRFSVSFLEYLLINGLESPHRLLNEYIQGHTDCLPGDNGAPHTSTEPELDIPVCVAGFEWDRLKTDQVALREAAEVVQSHLTKGKAPTFGPVTVRLVEYGLARLRDIHQGQIVEPLAFLSLMKWFENHPQFNLLENLRSRLASPPSRGHAFEELIILYMLRALRYPVPFTTIFEFHGTVPQWANEMTQIVGRLDGTAVAVGVLGGAPQNPGLGVVQNADTIDDVIKWIENPTTTPVLVPPTLFGPDVMLRCSNALLIGQLKSYTEGNKDSLNAKTMSDALNSLHKDHWFKLSPPDLRQKLIHVIERHRIIRFVGSYPLRADLNLRADSVTEAIAAFGAGAVLATINMDTFTTHFIPQDQARGVLEPMKHALAKKRNADEMDSGN